VRQISVNFGATGVDAEEFVGGAFGADAQKGNHCFQEAVGIAMLKGEPILIVDTFDRGALKLIVGALFTNQFLKGGFKHRDGATQWESWG